jgi:flagellar hook-basal body complex protein FliE
MNFFQANQVQGHLISLNRTHSNHIAGSGDKVFGEEGKSFSNVLLDAFNEVNNIQQDSTRLAELMITHPDEVDAHDVTITMAKANLAVSITKSVLDGALKAYREIINLR